MVTVLLVTFVINIEEKVESGGRLLDQFAASRQRPSPGLTHLSKLEAPMEANANAQKRRTPKLQRRISLEYSLIVSNILA